MLRHPTQRMTRGFTLIEMLASLFISSIVLASAVALFGSLLKESRETLSASRLHVELQTLVNIMANDIRRSGYWGDVANNLTQQENNPFSDATTDIAINGSCILFSYDRDDNGTLPAISSAIDDERYGFRLTNNAVQSRPPGAPFSCTAASNTWEDMTDPNVITITNLTFTKTENQMDVDGTGPGTAAVAVRSVDISITGELTSDTNVTKTVTQRVRVFNDRFIP